MNMQWRLMCWMGWALLGCGPVQADVGRPTEPPRLVVQTGHSFWVYWVAFSPDGKTVVSGSFDKTLKLWDVATGRELRTLAGHSSAVGSVAFSPDGKNVISGGGDTIKLWDVTSGQEQEWLR